VALRIDIKVDGLQALEARLLELDAIASQKLLRRAVRRSLVPLEKKATSNVSQFSRSGALAESIKIANGKPTGNEVVQIQVGPKYRDKRSIGLHNLYYSRKRKGIFYGHMVESGSKFSKARPWFVPAWNATRSGIIPEFKKILEVGLARLEKRKAQTSVNAEGLVDP